jgi:hypothetical protein
MSSTFLILFLDKEAVVTGVESWREREERQP